MRKLRQCYRGNRQTFSSSHVLWSSDVRCRIIIDGEAKSVDFGLAGQNFTRQLTMSRPAWQNNLLKQFYNKQAYNFYLDEVYAHILKSKF